MTSPADIPGLIERVTAATEGSRELDALILCVFPTLPFQMTPDPRWPGRVTFFHENGDPDSRHAADYSRSTDAALALMERVLPGAKWERRMDHLKFREEAIEVWWLPSPEADWVLGEAEDKGNTALAIILATLKALRAHKEAGE